MSRTCWIASIATFCFHLAVAISHGGPVAVPDVSAYLSIAQWTGGGQLTQNLGFFPGYGLLLSPATVFGISGSSIHTSALILNGVAAAVSVVLAAELCRRLGGGKALQGCACLLAVVHPSLSLGSRIAWPETLLVTGLLSICVCLSSKTSKNRYAISGGIAGLCLLLHPRAVVLVVALIILACVQKSLLKTLCGMLPPTLIGVVALTVTDSWPQSRVAAAQSAEIGSGLIATGLGQIVSASASTGGLVAIGLVIGIMALVNVCRRHDASVVSAFLALSVLGMVALGGLALAGSDRIDTFFYGRYIDIWSVPLSIVAITSLQSKRLSRANTNLGIGFSLASLILIIANSGLAAVEPRRIMTLSLAGLWELASNQISIVVVIGTFITVIAFWASNREPKLRLFLPIFLFVTVAIPSSILSHTHLHSVGEIAEGQTKTAILLPSEVRCLSHNQKNVPSYALWLYRLQLPEIRHERTSIEAGQEPCSRYLIADLEHVSDCKDIELLGSEPKGTWGLWYYPTRLCF
jgi:hypothetical protein